MIEVGGYLWKYNEHNPRQIYYYYLKKINDYGFYNCGVYIEAHASNILQRS